MARGRGRPDVILERGAVAVPPVGTRGPDPRKAHVAARAFAAWQAGEFGEPGERGSLRRAAEAFVAHYHGGSFSEVYYDSRIENLMRKLRAKAPK